MARHLRESLLPAQWPPTEWDSRSMSDGLALIPSKEERVPLFSFCPSLCLTPSLGGNQKLQLTSGRACVSPVVQNWARRHQEWRKVLHTHTTVPEAW